MGLWVVSLPMTLCGALRTFMRIQMCALGPRCLEPPVPLGSVKHCVGL